MADTDSLCDTPGEARARIHELFTGGWVLTVIADCLRRGAVPPEAGPILATVGLAERTGTGWAPSPGFAALFGTDLMLPRHLVQMATAASGAPARPGEGSVAEMDAAAGMLVRELLPRPACCWARSCSTPASRPKPTPCWPPHSAPAPTSAPARCSPSPGPTR